MFRFQFRSMSLIPALLLQACSLTPGMEMENNTPLSNIEVPMMVDGKLIKEKAKISQITADLIIDRENSKRREINDLPSQVVPMTAYKIGPHDRLQITVWEHPELNDPGGEKIDPELAGKMVQDDGMLYYPYVGNVQVKGKTANEVRELLSQGLSKYFKKVKLDVRVLSFQSHRAAVVGQVKTPGIQAMTETPLTITEAISRAGGVTEDADTSNVTLARDGKLYKIDVMRLYEKGGSEQNLLLKDGDVLNVSDRKDNEVFVMGEVGKQQALQINKGKLTLAQALAKAYGVDFNTSRAEEVYVIRTGELKTGELKPEIFQLDAKSPDALILADQFHLQAHDTVFVSTAGVTQWSRVLNQILPSSFTSVMSKAATMGL
ncbi:polysaccharide export outer membrane protein [Methylobacter tundripaludum]|uniref:Polysaccharide export outer membrane protein n=1 Tax=Methylobacter tundripaludum TaxID=173365 RepID=A0A2S6HB75_9GAMM|nr:polysaccharide biosynthesis/export family protein [Methylobacter tundripaludum]PPK74643.1 polysaccharide export outer membrane protein [Methylobacter tundripaludum]